MRKIFLLFFITRLAFGQQEKILVSDLTKIKQVVSINASPDGKKVVYSLKTSEANADKPFEFDYQTHLFLIDLADAANHKTLTRGKESASQPVFSPDGKSIAFVRAVKDKSQVFIMPLDGGEAWQLTNSKYGAVSPSFSPDGKKVLFSSGVSFAELYRDSLLNPSKTGPKWSMEKPGFAKNEFLIKDKNVKANPDGDLAQIRAYLDKDVEDRKAKVINRLNFHGEANVEPELRFSHVYVIDVKENAVEKPLTGGFWSYNGAQWTPDGKKIILTKGKDENEHPDREQESVVVIMDADGKNPKVIASENGKSFGGVAISPDGKKLAMIMNSPNLLSFGQVCLANVDGSGRQVVDFDRVPSGMTWSHDNSAVYFAAASNGGFPVFRLDAGSRKVERLSDYDSGISGFDLAGTQIIFAKNDIKTLYELHLADLKMQNARKISSINEDWLKGKKLSYPEKRSYKNSLGQQVDYWIMKPTFAEPGKKYPLLLQLHGGPTAMWGPGETSMWHEFQYFCAQGYGVVYPNPRGSGGYGKDFQFANYRDWGTGPQEDALAACTDAAKEAWVDTARQVITGGSYAGYLTAWIISHDHRFKAAFAQRGVYDLTTFMGEANAWRLTPNYFGLPWEDDKVTKITENSPYSYVSNIKTPFLIKHGESDLRTGVSQSEMMFRSLKYLGRDVEYVRMPGATHELSRSGNVRQRIDRILRIYEFFERFVSTGK